MLPSPSPRESGSRSSTAARRSGPGRHLPVVDGPRLDLPAPQVEDAAFAAALVGDRIRASILRMLREGPHCVCEMAAALDERQNNVSMHLAKLRAAGLVRQAEHEGDARWVFYERDEERCEAAAAALRDVLG